MSSIAEQWIKEGMEKGLQQGLQQGLLQLAAGMVLRLLRHKLGDLDAELQSQIGQLSFEQLNRLSDAFIDFKTVEDLKMWLATV